MLISSALHLEWTKARARRNRWDEEIQLLHEEMRRTIQFLQRQSQCWEERATQRVCERAEENEGLVAYAQRQAVVRWSMAHSFITWWRDVDRNDRDRYGPG
jgi:hypothetical protein